MKKPDRKMLLATLVLLVAAAMTAAGSQPQSMAHASPVRLISSGG